MNCINATIENQSQEIEILKRKVDFLAKTIKGCPTFHGYYKNCKGECQIGGVNSMSQCWNEIANKMAQV